MINRLLAQVNIGDSPLGGGHTLSGTYTSISPLVSALLRNSLVLAGIILLALLIFGGIGFIMSAGSGDSKKSGQSKQTITSALIGFAVVFCAYFIIQIIQVITGLHILNSGL
jgi:TRAP-type C4-dicarboxylate transport system permease small subunit